MSNGVYDLKWGQDLAARITPQIKGEVDSVRRVRPLIPIVPGKSAYENSVPNLTVAGGAGSITIPPSAVLPPIKISREFTLKQEQFGDELIATRLALSAAYELARAEDEIVLLGAKANLAALGVKDESGTLAQQKSLCQVPSPMGSASVDLGVLASLGTLQGNRHFGPYCAIVSPDLNIAAWTPIKNSAVPVIAPLLPQLREKGFQYSEALPAKTGVVFSLGKAAIDMAIPWDSHIECRKVEGDATFVVVEQVCLRVNDAKATTMIP